MAQNTADIISVSKFIEMEDVRIPEYQRPYKWTEKNVTQLVNDIFMHKDKSNYRLGTIVVHLNDIKEDNKVYRDIVDGQQRFTTLRILLYAIHKVAEENPTQYESYIIEQVNNLKKKVDKIPISYSSRESVEQIYKNFQTAFRLITKFDTLTIKAFLEKCEVVIFYISDITEAFQFFDSQNSRGKDLYPHDLLKAFHLREFDEEEESKQTKIVDIWEGYESKELAHVFSEYLYRIIGWADQNSSRKFQKKDITMFKGITISKEKSYPFIASMRIAHSFVDNYNSNFERQIDKFAMDYPFQLDSIMINGRRFFEYTAHYKKIIEEFKSEYEVKEWAEKMGVSQKIFYLAYYNSKNYRDGEKYMNGLFECLVIYYIDKFGFSEFEYFLEKSFVWVYSLRFHYQRLGFDSVDNHVVNGGNNLFHLIKKSINPLQVINSDISNVLPTKKQVDDFAKENNERMDYKIAEFFKNRMFYAN